VIQDSMSYDPIQDQGHEISKLKSRLFSKSVLHHLQCEQGSDN